MLIQEQLNKLILQQKLDRDGNTTMFFVIEEARKTVLDISQGTVKVL